jgi:hypothetical protein
MKIKVDTRHTRDVVMAEKRVKEETEGEGIGAEANKVVEFDRKRRVQSFQEGRDREDEKRGHFPRLL